LRDSREAVLKIVLFSVAFSVGRFDAYPLSIQAFIKLCLSSSEVSEAC
jgi:hypothetical protein